MPKKTQQIKDEALSDSSATARFGVGPAGEGREWQVYKGELVLVEEGMGSPKIVYRKAIASSAPVAESKAAPVAAPAAAPAAAPSAQASVAAKKVALGSKSPRISATDPRTGKKAGLHDLAVQRNLR